MSEGSLPTYVRTTSIPGERQHGARMRLTKLRLKNFQCFGPDPTTIDLDALSFLIGPNGAGKTAVLHALARLFAFEPGLRQLRLSDFHAVTGGTPEQPLWIEAQFGFPELADDEGNYATIPGHFAHMALETADGVPRMRIRLTATIDIDGEVDDRIEFVTQVDEDEEPSKVTAMMRHDRAAIQVHYVPARRDPSSHISSASSSLIGRILRSTNWQTEQETIAGLTKQISDALGAHAVVSGLSDQLSSSWQALHRGTHFAKPSVSFERAEIDALLRHLTIGFAPGHGEASADFTRLSDGQQSLLYVSLVLSVQAIGRKVLAGELDGFDIDKLRPPVFVLIAIEEPENSLSPHYLGRVLKELEQFSAHADSQVAVATHSPALLRRVRPEAIRYLRLNSERRTVVTTVPMPDVADEAYKFVREAVLAYPELYFSRLVILGEGDSEEVVLPRVLSASGLLADYSSISVAPLGGRHVHHFWRLLDGLGIPHVTLLDLDLGRYLGGWGRVKYAVEQLKALQAPPAELATIDPAGFAPWDDPTSLLDATEGPKWIAFLESAGVFFSAPLDLDFLMLGRYSAAYELHDSERIAPEPASIAAVLGKAHAPVSVYGDDALSLFDAYRSRFKIGSKPAEHLAALSKLDDEALIQALPEVLVRLVARVSERLAELPE